MIKKINDRYTFQFAQYLQDKHRFTITDIGDLSWMNKALYRKIRLDRARAITLGKVVYVRDWMGLSPNSRVGLCCHELRHIQQIQHLSAWRFYWNYGVNVDNRIKMEIAAYKRSIESSFILRGPEETIDIIKGYAENMVAVYRGDEVHEALAIDEFNSYSLALRRGDQPNIVGRMMDEFERNR